MRLNHSIRFLMLYALVSGLVTITTVSGQEPIQSAAENGNLSAVETWLTKDPSLISYRYDDNGDTLLHRSIKNAHNDVAEYLIDQHADINAVNKHGDTPLHCAVSSDNGPMIKSLLDHKADANVVNQYGETPLEELANAVRMSVSVPNLNTPGVGLAPMQDGDFDVKAAKLLLAGGSKLEAPPNTAQKPPLLLACFRQKWELAKLLIESGATVDVAVPDGPGKGLTALHAAAAYDNMEVTKLLIAHGAAVNARGNDGRTPLGWAILNKHDGMAAFLRQQGGVE